MMDMMMKKTSGAITNCRINGDNMVMMTWYCGVQLSVLYYIT